MLKAILDRPLGIQVDAGGERGCVGSIHKVSSFLARPVLEIVWNHLRSPWRIERCRNKKEVEVHCAVVGTYCGMLRASVGSS